MTARSVLLAAAIVAAAGISSASAQLGAAAQKTYSDFQRLGPHRVFMLAPNGRGYLWAGFTGHGAASNNAFPRKFGACIHAFIETGARQPPCS